MEESTTGSVKHLSVFSWKVHVKSFNNFPTAAGLASSASGIACFVYVISKLFGIIDEKSSPEGYSELSKIARQGSGSACRSLFGGYVRWTAGEREDGSDSYASEVISRETWPDMKALIFVVNDMKKTISSTAGMQSTVLTSTLFQHRISNVVPERMGLMEQALKSKDFQKFAELTMRDSNQFHATCLDTFPPIMYLNDVSKLIMNFINAVNQAAGKFIACYTYDAGPNAVVFFTEEHAQEFIASLQVLFTDSVLEGIPKNFEWNAFSSGGLNLKDKISFPCSLKKDDVKRLILTSVGEGTKVCDRTLFEDQ